MKRLNIITAFTILVFTGLTVVAIMKGGHGRWHSRAVAMWDGEDWVGLLALGENLHEVGKTDVEALYLAMLASKQISDADRTKQFAERLIQARAINWTIERRVTELYKPNSLRLYPGLYRTRLTAILMPAVLILLMISWKRSNPYRIAPVCLSVAGIIVLLL